MRSRQRSAAGDGPPDEVPHVPLPGLAKTALGWARAIFWIGAYVGGTIVVMALAIGCVVAIVHGGTPHWWLAKLLGGVSIGALR